MTILGVMSAQASTEIRLRELYAQAREARTRSRALAEQLRETHQKTQVNWHLIQASWDRAERIRAMFLAGTTNADRLRYSAYARMQAQLASMPVIEQAKGIIMAQCGWPEEQAFDALRRASQRSNIRVRDLAATIVAKAAHPGPRDARAEACGA
jgi:ANTAR domain